MIFMMVSSMHRLLLRERRNNRSNSDFQTFFEEFIFSFFQMYPFFFKIVHYYVNKTESLLTCRIFSNCCFVAYFVDKALVNDSTSSL